MENLNNQTIKHIFEDISKDLKELKELAKQTNGRIKSLEIWRARLAGGLAVIILLLVPIVIQYLAKAVEAYYK